MRLGTRVRQSEAEGVWTLQGTIFPENRASIALVERFGFRNVGRRERVAFHRGAWCDTVIYERRSTTAGV
jgi:phosphinothricin acetyltransferase